MNAPGLDPGCWQIIWGNRLLTLGLALAGLGVCTSIPLMYASAVASLLGAILTRCDPRPFLVGWPWACALSAWMLATTWTSPYTSAGDVPGFVYCWPLVAVWAMAASDLQRLRRTFIALIAGGALALLLGVAQFFIGYVVDHRPFRLSADGERLVHASGFYSHWIRFGNAMAIWGAWLGTWYLHVTPARGRAWLIASLGLFAGLCGVLLSSARGAMMAAIAGYWVAIAGGSRRRAMIATMVALACAGALAAVMWLYQPQRMQAALNGNDGRTYLWATAWQVFKQHPLTGVGNGAYDEAAKAVVDAGLSEAGPEGPEMGNAHNAYLSLLTLHGVPGLLLWCGWLTNVMWAIWRRRQAHPAVWPLACATLAVILVGGLTEDLARYASSRFQLFFGLALALGLAHSASSDPDKNHAS